MYNFSQFDTEPYTHLVLLSHSMHGGVFDRILRPSRFKNNGENSWNSRKTFTSSDPSNPELAKFNKIHEELFGFYIGRSK